MGHKNIFLCAYEKLLFFCLRLPLGAGRELRSHKVRLLYGIAHIRLTIFVQNPP